MAAQLSTELTDLLALLDEAAPATIPAANPHCCFKDLIGRVITNIYTADNEMYMRFQLTNGVLTYVAHGDCCSETWFADIFGFDHLLQGKVRSTDIIDLDSAYNLEDGRGRQEYDQVYGHKIYTTAGTAVISYRNSSNGYYGGWCKLYTNPTDHLEWVELVPDAHGIWRAA